MLSTPVQMRRATSSSATIPWMVVLINCMATLSLAFPFFTSYIALPAMMRSMSATLDSIQWVLTAFSIAQTAVMPIVGWLGSRLGNRRLFVLCLSLTTLGSLGCGLAWSTGSLVGFRVLQGLGAGLLAPLVTVIMFDAFPAGKRGLALGVNSTNWALGALLALPLGGYLIEASSWRTLFFLGIPWGVLSVAMAWRYLPQQTDPAPRTLDVWGCITLSGLLVPLLFGLSQGQRQGWGDTVIILSFALALVSGVVFVRLELRRTNPLLELRLFSTLPFAMACLVRFLNHIGFNAYSLLVALFLQNVLGYSPLRTGLLILPAAVAVCPTSLLGGRLTDRFDPRLIFMSGLALAGLGMYLLSTVTPWTPTIWVVLLVVLLRVGSECVFSPLSYAGLRLLPGEWVRMGSGMLSLMWGVGGSLGNAATAVHLSARQARHASLEGHDHGTLPWEQDQVCSDTTVALQGNASNALNGQAQLMFESHLPLASLVAAFQDCFLLTAVVYLVCLVPAFFVRSPRRPAGAENSAETRSAAVRPGAHAAATGDDA
jgi:DHA2 family multidrug resistance protein